MAAYQFDKYIRWNGTSDGTDLTLDTPQPVQVGAQSATDGSVDEEWTVGEEVISAPFLNGGGSAASDDGTFIGTVTGASGRIYPAFYDLSTFYWVFFGPVDATSDADATAMQAAGSVTVTPQTFQACFAAGTKIATPDGEAAVETLTEGDLVQTADRRAVAVSWVGHQVLFPSNLTPRMQPVRIRGGALGAHLPREDLIVTADHAIYLDGYLVQAAALVNRKTIDLVPLAECEFSLTVYHVETAAHEVLIANGLAAESYLDQQSRRCFDNFSDYADQHGSERAIKEMPVPRILSTRMLPPSIRARIEVEGARPALKLTA